MLLSISEHIAKLCTLTDNQEEQYEYLLKHKTAALVAILKIAYAAPNVKSCVSSDTVVWKKHQYMDMEGILYSEARRLATFIENGLYPDMSFEQRQNVFARFLETIDDDDAELVVEAFRQRGFKGLEKDVIRAAYPDIFE